MDGPRIVLFVDVLADALRGPDPGRVHVLARQDEVSKTVCSERSEQVEEVLSDDLAPDRDGGRGRVGRRAR